jgi:hypothetical protein
MFSFVRRVAAVLAVLLAAGVVPSQAQAQTNVLDTQADSAISLMTAQGMTLKQFRVGGLAEGGSTEFTLTMPAGKAGIIMAVCDGDCSDLDLKVTSGSTDIGSDYETDDTPMVAVQSFSGRMTVKVEMAACSAAPCGFRLMFFVN